MSRSVVSTNPDNATVKSNIRINRYLYMFGRDLEPKKNAPAAPLRLLNLMKMQVADFRVRLRGLQDIRFKNEKSYEYQTGYVMAEIIEKYRLMMEHHQRPMQYPSDPLFNTLRGTEHIQTLYIEIWHLCMMLHEIHRKTVVASGAAYDSEQEAKAFQSSGHTAKQNFHEQLLAIMKLEKKLQKKRRRERRLVMELYQKYENSGGLSPNLGKFVAKQSWPLDYGWDLAYRPGREPKLAFSTVYHVERPIKTQMTMPKQFKKRNIG